MSNYVFIPGEVAHIRFTGEQVGVIRQHAGNDSYDVRRAVRSKVKGTKYVEETYFGFELEDAVSFVNRRKHEYDELARQMKAAGVAILDDRPKGPTGPPTHENMPN